MSSAPFSYRDTTAKTPKLCTRGSIKPHSKLKCMSGCIHIAPYYSMAFQESLAFALERLHQPDLTLKEQQIAVTEHVYHGRDVFAWLPTGFGKSLCYHCVFSSEKRIYEVNHSIKSKKVYDKLLSIIIETDNESLLHLLSHGALTMNQKLLSYAADQQPGGRFWSQMRKPSTFSMN